MINSSQFIEFFGSTYFGNFTTRELKYAFRLLDRNCDGYLDRTDLALVFVELDWHHCFDINGLFDALDKNKTEKLSFEGKKYFIISLKTNVGLCYLGASWLRPVVNAMLTLRSRQFVYTV
jgi:Ca2+-binding EF-hand superfamily protein